MSNNVPNPSFTHRRDDAQNQLSLIQGSDDAESQFCLTPGPDNAESQFCLTPGPDNAESQFCLTPGPDNAESQSSLTQGLDNTEFHPSLNQEPDYTELELSLSQSLDHAEALSNPTQRHGNVIPQQSANEESAPIQAQTSSSHPDDVQDTNLVFNLGNKQAPQIGDTNIHTTGPVYNAPVYQQQITQHVTVHQTNEQAHCSSQLRAPNYLDEEILPKRPASRPTLEQTHCSFQLPAQHSLNEETLPKRPASRPTLEQTHCSFQLPAQHSLNEEILPKRPASRSTLEQTHCSFQLPAQHSLDEETLPKHPASLPLSERAHCSSQLPAPRDPGERILPKPSGTTFSPKHSSSQLTFPYNLDNATSPKLSIPSSSSAQWQRISEHEPSTSTEHHKKHENVQYVSGIMSLLNQRAQEIASEESSLADFAMRPIPTVNLTIVSKPQQIDEFQAEGHYRRREDFVKVYDRPESDITGEEMFGRAKQTAQEEADQKFKKDQEKAKQDYVEKHGNVVGVVGQAGIGKTTSAKKWAMQGLRGELFGETSFFFYIVIRHIDFTKKMTLLEFLLSTMSIEQDYTPDQENRIVHFLCNDPNVVMIFDGFDEAAFKSFSAIVSQPVLHSKSKAENYLKHLAGGNLLPRARKIFTSRPTQLYKLHPSYRPRFIVQILGLTPTSQDELGRQVCGDRYKEIQQKLEQNRNVFAYCYVPVNFILTLVFLMNYDGDTHFVTLTRVLAFTCGQYLTTNHLRGQEVELDKLAKLAYDAFLDMEIVFKATAFKKAGIKETTADAFTNTSVTKHGNLKLTILDGYKVRYFSHLIWQEFFVGFYLMMIMSLDEFEKIPEQLADDRWEVVSKFVFGICDPSVFHQLEPLVLESSRKNWKQKKSLLLKFIRSKPKLSSKDETKRVCSWAHESNDPEIASSVASLLLDELDLRNSYLLAVDYENLAYVIQHRATPLKILDLSENEIGNTGATSLAPSLHKTEKLRLQKCDFGSEGVQKLCDGVKKLTKPLMLKTLDLSCNKFGNAGAVSLAPCLHNIKILILNSCKIGSEGVEKLCGEVEKLTMPMELLDLSYNLLKDESAKSLARCVHNIGVLKVWNNGFTEALKNLIRSNSRGEVEFEI